MPQKESHQLKPLACIACTALWPSAAIPPHHQGGGHAVAVHRYPDLIAGNLPRVGEEQKGASRQGRIEKVFTGTTEDLLRDHDPEADTQGRLPQRDIGRHDQGEQHGGDKKTFVDFVVAYAREDRLPDDGDREHDDVEGNEVQRAVNQAGQDAVGVIAHGVQEHGAPVVDGGQPHLGHPQIGLIAGVVPADQQARKGGDVDIYHDPFEVQTIPHMGRCVGVDLWGIEKSVYCLVDGIEVVETSTLGKQWMEVFQDTA